MRKMGGGGGGRGEKNNNHHHNNLLSFHLHFPHLISHGKKEELSTSAIPPKGCMAIRVGQEGEEVQRFIVPIVYLYHPLFVSLLKEAEEEYGFEHKGVITIPCHVEHFRQVQGIIDRENGSSRSGYNHHYHHHHHQLLNVHLSGCFKA